jgi:hypothetical protein
MSDKFEAKKTKYKELEENNTFHIGSNCVCGLEREHSKRMQRRLASVCTGSVSAAAEHTGGVHEAREGNRRAPKRARTPGAGPETHSD